MKYYLLLFLLLTFNLDVNSQSITSKGKNFPNKGAKHTETYGLKYYYPEDPEKIIFKRVYGRTSNNNGTFCLIDYDPAEKNKPTYSSCFDGKGIPIAFGNNKEQTKIYKDSIRLNFKYKDTTISINATKILKDPTVLWFWKHMPKVNETVTVNGIRKNFITNTIDLVSVVHTYLGKDIINILGNMETCHLVKSMSLNGSKDIYDEKWFDKQGMLVKVKHVVGKDGSRIGVLYERGGS